MDYNQVILLQKQIVKYHKVLACLLIVTNLQQYAAFSDKSSLLPSIVVLALLTFESILSRVHSIKMQHLAVVKYVYICLAVFFVVTSSNMFIYGIGLLCLFLFCLEFYVNLDFTDNYIRKWYIVLVSLPIIACILYQKVTTRMGEMQFAAFILVFCIFICITFIVAESFSTIIQDKNNKMFAQTRLIERINETNEELRIHQEKVKSTNELLGVQKIKLESAYNKINNVNEEMRIQNDILKYISSSLEIEKLMSVITESIINRIGVDVCAIVLKPGVCNSDNVMYKVEGKLGNEFMHHLSACIEKNCFDELVADSKTFVDNYVGENIYTFAASGELGSILIVPLMKQEEQIGCLFVGQKKYDFFVENTGFFQGIVSQFIIALNNASLYQEMQSMAILDGLTGIYNRRYLTKLFNQYMYDSINSGMPLSTALFDIDFFKKINDTYGHLFGDEVIKTIAALANQIAKENDAIAARYGGEEFVIIFPNKNLEEAYPAVVKLHAGVKELGLIHNGKPINVNVSVGFTSYPKTCKDPRELLNRADWSMYYSKQHGRDQITIDSEEIQKAVALD